MGWRTEQAVQRHIADHGGHVVELYGTIWMVMCTAGRLLLACIAAVRPVHDLERRRSRPADVALETAPFAHDGHSMTRTSMCFRPAVQDRAGPTLFNMPAVERAFGAPASGGRDDQVGRLQKFEVALQELMQAASTDLDLKMRKIGLQPLGQSLRFVAANCGGTQRMPADIWPTQVIIFNQNDPARARLRERAGDRRTNRSAPDDHDGGI